MKLLSDIQKLTTNFTLLFSNGFKAIFSASLLSANRTYTLKDRDGILADDTDLLGKQDSITLTTSGTSGAATLIGTTLNIPQYSGGVGGGGIDESLAIAYAIAL